MRTLAVLTFLALVAGCSSSSNGDTKPSCALPAGMECCDGDIGGRFTCDAVGNVVCSDGTRLTPSKECTLPLPTPPDAGSDADDGSTCALPSGMECCAGDVLGGHSCAADGGVVCLDGTHLTPSNECTAPVFLDGGGDAGDAGQADAAHD